MTGSQRFAMLLLLGGLWACGSQEPQQQTEKSDSKAAAPPHSRLWAVETLEKGGGFYSSLALDASGNPHIGYFDPLNNRLRYATFDGSWHFSTVEEGGGGPVALTVDPAGRPLIVYSKASPGEMIFARPEGKDWKKEKVADVSYAAYVVRADASGKPHVAYRDFSATCVNILKYAVREGDRWKVTNVDEKTCSGQSIGLALTRDGKPRITYNRDYPLGEFYSARLDGSWRIEKVDSGNAGRYSSIALDSRGNPHVAYSADGKLKYGFHDGSSWHLETVDGPQNVGFYCSVALDAQDRPHVSYWDVSHNDLKYATRDAGGWKAETVDGQGKVGLYTSLALDAEGRPHVSYYDETTRSLKYAQLKRSDSVAAAR